MILTSVRAVEKQTGVPIAILQDLQGPKIRLGVLPEAGMALEAGKTYIFDTGVRQAEGDVIPVGYEDLHRHVKKGERFLLCDGKIEGVIVSVKGTKIEVKIRVSGSVSSHKGINVPDTDLPVRALTDKDKEDAKFGVAHGVEYIALSFAKNAQDILDLRAHIDACQKELKIRPANPIRIIVKVERQEAIKNIKEILAVVDGIMVARGDLGVEIKAAEVPVVQKRLIELALEAQKPVIVATQMLDSMQDNPRPTRAEVSDVANAVIDHTDAVMLSNETATGKYPVETVAMMTEIIRETEHSKYDDMSLRRPPAKKKQKGMDDIVEQLSGVLAEGVNATLILAASATVETGRTLSSYRPQLPLCVATSDVRVQRQLNLSWGVYPFLLPVSASIDGFVDRAFAYLKKNRLAKKKDEVVIVAGEPVGEAGNISVLEVREVS